MSGTSKPAANRSGTAACASSKRAGRLDERAWRDVQRALRLGKKHDAHAVECHGYRFVFRHAQQPPLETTGGKSAHKRAERPQDKPVSAPAAHGPNHAQRKSAERMRRFIESKQAGVRAQPAWTAQAPPSTTLAVVATAPVENDTRMADVAPARAEDERRGQKRAADEPSACEPIGPVAPTHAPKEQRVQQQAGDRCKPCETFARTYLEAVLEDHFENACRCAVRPSFEYRWSVPKEGCRAASTGG